MRVSGLQCTCVVTVHLPLEIRTCSRTPVPLSTVPMVATRAKTRTAEVQLRVPSSPKDSKAPPRTGRQLLLYGLGACCALLLLVQVVLGAGLHSGTHAALWDVGRKALIAGTSGAVAGLLEVPLLMWLRTVMNYQYRHGTPFFASLRQLYAEGGVARLYSGIVITLVNTSLARFGEMGANAGVLALMGPSVPLGVRTMVASATSVAFRILITPIDTIKTSMQVEGPGAVAMLRRKVAASGIGVLYHGATASSLANFVGTYPWFWTFNALDAWLSPAPEGALAHALLRSATLGLCAACASDTCSNSFRVLKAVRQTSPVAVSYAEAARQVIAKDGVVGLFGRGLSTRLAINGLQSSLFGVFWKGLQAARA